MIGASPKNWVIQLRFCVWLHASGGVCPAAVPQVRRTPNRHVAIAAALFMLHLIKTQAFGEYPILRKLGSVPKIWVQ